MPIGMSNGMQFETEFDRAKKDYDDWIGRQNDSEMEINPETNALEKDLKQIESGGMIDVKDDWFFKDRKPTVRKPEMYKPDVMSPQDRMNQSFDAILEQQGQTERNIRRQKRQQTAGFQKVADKKEIPGQYIGELPDDEVRSTWENEGTGIMVPYGRRQSKFPGDMDTIEQVTDPKEIMKKHPDSEGYTVKGNPYLFIRKPGKAPLTS